jgi:hypothetical protein
MHTPKLLCMVEYWGWGDVRQQASSLSPGCSPLTAWHSHTHHKVPVHKHGLLLCATTCNDHAL